MGKAEQSVEIGASLAEVWAFYFEPKAWPSWVDQFRGVDSANGYPEADGTLRWRSTPAGRGPVSERVLAHEPRRLHRIEFSDEHSEGELETTFEIAGEKVKVTQRAEYRVREHGAFGPLTDRLFVRPQVRRSLARSLARLKVEVESLAAERGASDAA
jgi:uncharacterized protein YndB with AHSA1/START domain